MPIGGWVQTSGALHGARCQLDGSTTGIDTIQITVSVAAIVSVMCCTRGLFETDMMSL